MKKITVYSLLAILALAGCQTKENKIQEQALKSLPFTATIEDDFGVGTKTSLDADGNVRWKQGDQVSIFAGSTVNEQYQVTDASDGKTAAAFNKVTGSGFVGGIVIDNNVAFYPYASTAEIAKSGSSYVISDISLPATQTYAAGSFGNGAFAMTAVTSSTSDYHLKFKNVLGGLKLQLKGTATISSITVTGNNNEILCGDAEVTVSSGSIPSINLTDASAKTVTLNCGSGVVLNTETATAFIIALPPMTMSGGFTVIVTDTNGGSMEIKTTKSQTINRSRLLNMPAVNYVGTSTIPEPTAEPLKFTASGSPKISLTKVGDPYDISLEYKVNDGEWTDYTVGEAISLTYGQELSFRAGISGNDSFCVTDDNYYNFTITGTGTVAASGNIMTLLDRNGGSVIPTSYCFHYLFKDCSRLTTAPTLPATTLKNHCYNSMFWNCTRLTTAPELPATTLAVKCYYYMFYGCTSLTTAPALPATILNNNCYDGMFKNCTGLITPPSELPAATLAEWCYFNMFNGCTSLITSPELPATTLARGCYSHMFQNCTSLTTPPSELSATTLTENCCSYMFDGCSSLTTAPALPATSLANYCYELMFRGCSSLTTAPVLPATTMKDHCYYFMFNNCTHLTTAPALPATSLMPSCYYGMFKGCIRLTESPILPATTLSPNCYHEMFNGCSRLNYVKALFESNDYVGTGWLVGVSETGTFVRNRKATWLTAGSYGIPEGWTVITE